MTTISSEEPQAIVWRAVVLLLESTLALAVVAAEVVMVVGVVVEMVVAIFEVVVV